MRKIALIFFLICFGISSQGQTADSLKVLVSFPDWSANSDQQAILRVNGEEIQIRKFRFFIGLHEAGQRQTCDAQRWHLVDAFDPSTHHASFARLESNSVVLGFGVDSLCNTSGAMDGALDPVSGMYWTWQSGYINLKLEGEILRDGKSEKFTYHLGGYGDERDGFHEMPIELNESQNVLPITIDLAAFIQALFTHSEDRMVMSPSAEAAQMQKLLKACVQVQ